MQLKYLTSAKLVAEAHDLVNSLPGYSQGLGWGLERTVGGSAVKPHYPRGECLWPAGFWTQSDQSHTHDLEGRREAGALLLGRCSGRGWSQKMWVSAVATGLQIPQRITHFGALSCSCQSATEVQRPLSPGFYLLLSLFVPIEFQY